MKTVTWYDKEEDILGIQLSSEKSWKSIELPNGIIIDVSENGKVLGLEISNAKKIFSGETRTVLEKAIAH